MYEFKSPRVPKDAAKEEEEILKIIAPDSDDDDEFADDLIIEEDPLLLNQPPNKKQKIQDVSHLKKRFKGKGAKAKRPPGKMNDPLEDLIYVSDGDFDADDPDAL